MTWIPEFKSISKYNMEMEQRVIAVLKMRIVRNLIVIETDMKEWVNQYLRLIK